MLVTTIWLSLCKGVLQWLVGLPELYVLLKPASAGCFIDAFLLVLLGAATGFSVVSGSRAEQDVLLLSVLLCSFTCVATCDGVILRTK